MATYMSEGDWQKRITDAATAYGWRWMHVRKAKPRAGKTLTPTSLPGWPDLTLWHPLRRIPPFFAELKRDTEHTTPEQIDVLGSLEASGARTLVWRPRDWDHIHAVLSGVVSIGEHIQILTSKETSR